LATKVPSSPFTHSHAVGQLTEGEFNLVVMAGSGARSEAGAVKGQGCEMTLKLGRDEKVAVSIA
jgi:hypothetical protein